MQVRPRLGSRATIGQNSRADGRLMLIVHLVHGTWPFGPFGKKSPQGKPAWFEQTSAFRKQITKSYGAEIQFRQFRWSGRNSHLERMRAADALVEQLKETIRSSPNARHAIIAHSHGGTVVALALMKVDDRLRPNSISSVICMATPFALIVPATKLQKLAILTSVCLVPASLLLSGIAFAMSAASRNNAIFLSPLAFATLGVPFLEKLSKKRRISSLSVPSKNTPLPFSILLLRATRDEASLTIGIAQSLRFLACEPAEKMSFLSLWWLIPIAALCAVLIYISIKADELGWGLVLTVAWPLLLALPSVIYLLGYCLLAMATGHSELLDWPFTLMEVEQAPPWTSCKFEMFLDLEGSVGMRHAIYTRADVLDRIVRELRVLAKV